MKPKKILLGNSDFKNIIQADGYFVDKTLFIKEIIDAGQQVILFPRPRRFGKTMNLSMLRYFFDNRMPENKALFKDLNIWQNNDQINEHCCKHPVIFLSFKDAKGNSWEKTLHLIKTEITNLYTQHKYLLNSNNLDNNEKLKIKNIINEKALDFDYDLSIKRLSEYLYKHHNKNVVILVDEYDTPIQSGYNKFYEEVISFMRNLLSGAFKDNSYLYKGVITGILRVSKESIFSGLNNIDVYSVFNHDFADKFGFTKPEVEQILADFEQTDKYEEIKHWYNGYKFGQTENIYNPWSILNYLSKSQEGFQTFWTQTSTNDLIKNEIKKKDAEIIRQDILTLINNQTIVRDIEENFSFPDMASNKDLLWSLLIYSGYLTVAEQKSRRMYALKIPNYELKTVFQDTITEWFQTDIKVRKSTLIDTFNHLVNNNIPEFESGFKTIMGDTFSYYDTAKVNEYVFQSYMLGLLAVVGDDYIIKSNRESGLGRYDIMLIPHDKSRFGIVIELKQTDKQLKSETDEDFRQRIQKDLTEASAQIETNKYYKELIDNKIQTHKIISIPIVFAGKEPYITRV